MSITFSNKKNRDFLAKQLILGWGRKYTKNAPPKKQKQKPESQSCGYVKGIQEPNERAIMVKGGTIYQQNKHNRIGL